MNISDKIKQLARDEPLSCEAVNTFIMDYLEGSMDEQTRMRFEVHLRGCANCERFLDQYRETITSASLLREESGVELPDEVVRRTLDFLKNHYDG